METHTSKTFAMILRQVRREAGYATAYAFYHKNGGRAIFPFTYVHYLRLERAVSLPRPEWMPTLLFALRLPQHSTCVRELNIAYLKALLRTAPAYESVLAPLLAASPGRGFSETSAALWRARQTVHMTPKQFLAVASDSVVYWCSEFILNDRGSFRVEDLASLTGASAAAVGAALAELRTTKLVKSVARGRWRSAKPGAIYSFPGRLPGLQKALDRIAGYWEARARRDGGPVAWRMELVRASARRIAAYSGSLLESVDSAADLSTHDKGEDTGFFLVRAEIKKILPY